MPRHRPTTAALAACFAAAALAGAARGQGVAVGSAPAASSETIAFAGMPASFALPAGWRLVDQQGDLVVLAPAVAQPEVLVAAHSRLYSSIDEFYELAAQTIDEEFQIQGLRVTQSPQTYSVNGLTASGATLAGSNQYGEPLRVGLNVVISGNGVGLGVLTLASVPTFEQGRAAADSVLRSARFGALTQNRQAAAGLAGHWVRSSAVNSGNRGSSAGGVSSGSNVSYTFYGDGTYEYRYESFAAFDVPGLGGLSSDSDEDSGRYFVSGSTLTLIRTMVPVVRFGSTETPALRFAVSVG